LAKYGKPVWRIVLEAAKSLDMTVFSPKDVIKQAHIDYPEIPNSTLRTYVIAMAPNHSSSHHYPSTHKNHRYFNYLGSGKFCLGAVDPPGGGGQPGPPPTKDPRTVFIETYCDIINSWVDLHFQTLVEARKTYTWAGKPTLECVRDRNAIQTGIVESRIQNGGGLDLQTINQTMDWGGMRHFKVDEKKALQITKDCFKLLDDGLLKEATLKLTAIYDVGIASASKLIGLYDQNRYAIYDSRVGTALRSLESKGKRLIKCPPGRGRPGDVCTNKVWAKNYEKLIWTLEHISKSLSEKGYPFNVADVEMALFMMGK
jgi:hypothetical protein